MIKATAVDAVKRSNIFFNFFIGKTPCFFDKTFPNCGYRGKKSHKKL
jgi:hypothetical protein